MFKRQFGRCFAAFSPEAAPTSKKRFCYHLSTRPWPPPKLASPSESSSPPPSSSPPTTSAVPSTGRSPPPSTRSANGARPSDKVVSWSILPLSSPSCRFWRLEGIFCFRVLAGLSEIMLEAQRSVGWIHGLDQKDAKAATRRLLRSARWLRFYFYICICVVWYILEIDLIAIL